MALQRKLTFITLVYWFLLLYVIAALIWWFIALNRQSNEMVALKLSEISENDPQRDLKVSEVQKFKKRKVAQYTGEGIIFLLLIGVGAIFVYRATRKQLQLAQQQQNFMMAITHELKTPIAIARLNIETLQKRKLDEERQKQLLQITLLETDRLNDLANNILLASRMDGGDQEYFAEQIDLVELGNDLVRQFADRYPERKFEHKEYGACVTEGDPLLLRILISNLLDNAVKYSPSSKPILYSCQREKDFILVKVADEGPGIPETEKRKVFEKFYRMGSEATRSTKGTGLGLYLCQRIARTHHGTIRVMDNKPSGCIFEVRLPAAGLA